MLETTENAGEFRTSDWDGSIRLFSIFFIVSLVLVVGTKNSGWIGTPEPDAFGWNEMIFMNNIHEFGLLLDQCLQYFPEVPNDDFLY